jgi:hypothetical protein
MKAIKFIFAILLLSNIAISCSSDATEDDALYSVEQLQATGEESAATVDRSRD